MKTTMSVITFKPRNTLDRTFLAGLVIKGLDGLLELAGAALLGFVGPGGINAVVTFLTQRELTENPHSLIAGYVLHAGQHLASGGTTFAVFYLLIHGLVKVVAVAALLRDQLWAYPFSLVTLGLFMLYQIYEIGLSRSVGFTLLTIFDAFVLWLIWREYRERRRLPPAQSS